MKAPEITKYPLQRLLILLVALLSFFIQYPQPIPKDYTDMALTYTSSPFPDKPLHHVTIVITGATSGLGLSLSKKVHSMGGTLVAIGRSESKLRSLEESVGSVRFHGVLADFTDLNSISAAADTIQSKFKNIDYLICNAGITSGTGPTAQNYDEVFGVNYLSHVLLTEKLIPLLKRSKLNNGARVINISSTMHMQVNGEDLVSLLDSYAPVASHPSSNYVQSWKSYGNSKLAQIYYARSLSRKLKEDDKNKIRVLSLCPSWVATNIAGSNAKNILDLFAYQSDGFGIAPILFAMFDTSGGDNDDFVRSNSITKGGIIFKSLEKILRITNWPLGRLCLTSFGASFILVVQKFFADVGYGLTSAESFNTVYQDILYTWSLEVLKPWLRR